MNRVRFAKVVMQQSLMTGVLASFVALTANAEEYDFVKARRTALAPLKLSVSSAKSTFHQGEPIVVSVSITNTSDADSSVPGVIFAQQNIRLIIRDSKGVELSPASATFTPQVSTGHPLYMARQRTFTVTDDLEAWHYALQPGHYRLVAEWLDYSDHLPPLLTSQPLFIDVTS